MSFKISYAFIKGSWDGTPGSSNFTQSTDVFATPAEFYASYSSVDSKAVVDEYNVSGDIVQRAIAISADGKVKINTIEYIDEAAHDAYVADGRWSAEESATKVYNVEEAAAPEDVNTFDEGNEIYYHSSAHLF